MRSLTSTRWTAASVRRSIAMRWLPLSGMHPLVRYLILSGLAFIAVVIEQQFWPHHGRTVGIGFGVLVVVALGTIDSLLGTDRRSAAGDLLVGRVVLVGVAALIVAALLLQVTSLCGVPCPRCCLQPQRIVSGRGSAARLVGKPSNPERCRSLISLLIVIVAACLFGLIAYRYSHTGSAPGTPVVVSARGWSGERNACAETHRVRVRGSRRRRNPQSDSASWLLRIAIFVGLQVVTAGLLAGVKSFYEGD